MVRKIINIMVKQIFIKLLCEEKNMNGKCTNHVLLAVLGILVLLLNTSPTLAYSNGMTKQDFENFIDGRTINFDAMYHGGWTDETPDIWITPGTYSIAYMHINSAGKLWYVGISSNIITYGDDSSNILTDTIPNDVFTAATNALAPYLRTTYIAPKSAPVRYIAPAPTPTPYIAPKSTPVRYIASKQTSSLYIAPAPTQQKTRQDFVNFIGGRIPDYQALPQGYSTASEPNIWKSSISFSESVYIYSGDGSLWRVSIRCNDPSTTRCIWYDDMQAQQTVMTIPSDVFTIATNGIAPFLKNRPPI